MPEWLDGIDLVITWRASRARRRACATPRPTCRSTSPAISTCWTPSAPGPPPRILFVSSRLVYGVTGCAAGRRGPPRPPDQPLRPAQADGRALPPRIYHQHYGLPYTILRLTNPYGPFQLPPRPASTGSSTASSWRRSPGGRFGSSAAAASCATTSTWRDVVEALLRAGTDERAVGETLNLGSGRSVSLGEVAAAIVAAGRLGAIETVPWPEDDRKVETGDFRCDTRPDRGACSAGRPRTGLEDGLRRTRRGLPRATVMSIALARASALKRSAAYRSGAALPALSCGPCRRRPSGEKPDCR